jgi:outer membrane protein assembly factor BamA
MPPRASPHTPAPVEPLKIKFPEASVPSPPPILSTGSPIGDEDYATKRYEPAGFPLLGGSSDIGFQFGVVGTLSHFADGIKPYAWNMDAVVSASIKDGPTGPQFVQQSYLFNADLPGYLGGKLRFNPQVQYQRTINMGYFGLGDAASGVVPANYRGTSGRYFEWIDSIASAYVQARYLLSYPWSLTAAVGYRYMAPTAYADSKLARDAEAKNADGSPVIRGLQPLSITQLAVGASYDSRDNEVFPGKGSMRIVGVDYQQGIPLDSGVRYGEAQALIQGYHPLIGPFILAGRAIADFQFGHVPFYDLSESGPFAQSEAIGGGSAIRGVPIGRYSGEIKIYGNVEVRAMLIKFHLFKQKVSFGSDGFFDAGRSWLDYSFKSPLDGTGTGIKYGVGGGIYILWGQAALFRIDAAYSPDAAAENPSFPLGLYVSDGVSF